MPHIRFRAVRPQDVAVLSEILTPKLAELTEAPVDYFTYEYIQTEFYKNGQIASGDPFIEVHWFDRGQECQDKVAKEITSRVKELIGDKDIVVYFFDLKKSAYYENGNHFG
ncbi:MAG: pseudouridine synthase [Bdellovibrio sp. SCN 50-8]|nr:MAG: pseudouridine synthase [Bdellovibrio sp. SCN 50-8]